MRICTCGRTTYGMNALCLPCRTPKPRKPYTWKTPIQGDLSAAEIDQRFHAALAIVRRRRLLGAS